jgi:hypothetical protein
MYNFFLQILFFQVIYHVNYLSLCVILQDIFFGSLCISIESANLIPILYMKIVPILVGSVIKYLKKKSPKIS